MTTNRPRGAIPGSARLRTRGATVALVLRPGPVVSALRRDLPAVLASAEQVDPGALAAAGWWRATRPRRTSTAVVMLELGRPDEPPAAVLKIAQTLAAEAGLIRHAATVRRLSADDRLPELAPLLPRQLARGRLDGSFYLLEAALPGRPAHRLPVEARRQLLDDLSRRMQIVHSRTAVTGEDADRQLRWISEALDRIAALLGGGVGRAFTGALTSLSGELGAAVSGRSVLTGWIHGDLWLGNVLASTSGTTTGIVDWDRAGPHELACLDVLHLLLYNRRVEEGRDLGAVVNAALEGRRWNPVERSILDRTAASHPWPAPDGRLAVLLYWLRHTATFAAMRDHGDNRFWVRRNVESVLRRL